MAPNITGCSIVLVYALVMCHVDLRETVDQAIQNQVCFRNCQ